MEIQVYDALGNSPDYRKLEEDKWEGKASSSLTLAGLDHKLPAEE